MWRNYDTEGQDTSLVNQQLAEQYRTELRPPPYILFTKPNCFTDNEEFGLTA